jgi:hypothetical protein
MRSIWREGASDIPAALDADLPQEVQLAPFEVLTLELMPIAEAE